MDIDVLRQIGLSEIQAKIYLWLIEHGQKTPSEIATGINEKRTTVYSALERLNNIGIITKKEKGKIASYSPNHPSMLEKIAERKLRIVAKQAKNLESSLPSLINYYNEHLDSPGAIVLYGQEGVDLIREKVIDTGKPFYFIRSTYDESMDMESLNAHKKARADAGIQSENITPANPMDYANSEDKNMKIKRNFIGTSDYASPIEIDIFGDNVAFINYEKNGMSALIESPEIADAMRQFFLFSKKYIKKAASQDKLNES